MLLLCFQLRLVCFLLECQRLALRFSFFISVVVGTRGSAFRVLSPVRPKYHFIRKSSGMSTNNYGLPNCRYPKVTENIIFNDFTQHKDIKVIIRLFLRRITKEIIMFSLLLQLLTLIHPTKEKDKNSYEYYKCGNKSVC